MTLADVTIETESAEAAADWSSSFVAIYDFESAGSPWNASAGSCSSGTDCDMSATGSPARTTTSGQYIEGSAGASVDVSQANYYIACAAATCDEIRIDGTNSLTVGGWLKVPSTSGDLYFMGRQSLGNYYAYRDAGADDRIRCQAYDSSPATKTHDGDSSGFPDDAWTHVACVFDEANDTIDSFDNGADDTGQTSFTGPLATNASLQVRFLTNGVVYGGGTGTAYYDTLYVYEGVLTSAELARIGACGIDGADCTCTGATWTTKGKVSANCTDTGDPYACCTGNGTGCIDAALLTDDCNKANP
jgi:hypothetical protein